MLIRTTDGKTIFAGYGDKLLEIGPKATEFGPFESRFILGSYFARNYSPNVEAVSPKHKAAELDTEPEATEPTT